MVGAFEAFPWHCAPSATVEDVVLKFLDVVLRNTLGTLIVAHGDRRAFGALGGWYNFGSVWL